jgi:DNA repair protein RecO (recombination protein O)
MHIRSLGIVCAVRPHAEHGSIVRVMTAEHGIVAGYVRGGRSRINRPILIPANIVDCDFRARTDNQLASLTVEMVHSRGPLLAEPLASAVIDWATALTAATLPEEHPYPQLYEALSGLLAAVEAAPAARRWVVALVRYEVLILAELGFGLDLSACTATGATTDLIYVSPKSAAAVSAVAGEPYKDRLLRLPQFVANGGDADWPDLFDGLLLTGHFLERDLLGDRKADVLAARERLVDRLKRTVA